MLPLGSAMVGCIDVLLQAKTPCGGDLSQVDVNHVQTDVYHGAQPQAEKHCEVKAA